MNAIKVIWLIICFLLSANKEIPEKNLQEFHMEIHEVNKSMSGNISINLTNSIVHLPKKIMQTYPAISASKTKRDDRNLFSFQKENEKPGDTLQITSERNDIPSPFKINNYDQIFPFFEQFSLGYKLLFYFAILASFFLLNIAIVTLITVLSNWLMNRRSRWYNKTRDQVIDILSPLVFGEDETNFNEKEHKFAEHQLSKYKSIKEKRVVIDVMLETRRNLTGSSIDILTNLYSRLELENISIINAKSINPYRRIMGIRELAYLSTKSHSLFLAPYLNSRDAMVRLEVILAYILMEKQSPLEFLKHLDRPFSRWIQLSAYYTLYFNDLAPPSARSSLNHRDPQVIIWCLRLIATYNQFDSEEEVTHCLSHPNPEVRIAAIQTSEAIENWQAKAPLKEKYSAEPLKIKIEILSFLKHFSAEEDIPFLTELAHTGTFIEKREAVRILYKMNDNSRKILQEVNDALGGKLNRFINHITDPLNETR